MNKKGICFYFGYQIEPQQRAKMIKDAGFDNIITSGDKKFNKQNGSVGSQYKVMFKENLGLSSFHMRYKNSELKYFWENHAIGDKIEKDLKKDIILAKKYGFNCVVVHLYGTPSEIGFNRLRRVLGVCEDQDLPIAIENIDCFEVFKQTFQKIHSKYLKFCYDIGHNNCFDPKFDYLSKYGDKLISLHLHSNDGTKDMHTLNKYGNIDWEKFAKKIAKINPDINLDYEVLMLKRKDETAEEVLREVYSQARELESMIQKYCQTQK